MNLLSELDNLDNWKKGLKITLRSWQELANQSFCEYVRTRDFMTAFTEKADTGLGKSINNGLKIHTLRRAGLIEWAIILVPNNNLVKQTIRSAHKAFGLELTDGALGNDRKLLRDQGYCGEVLTYACLTKNKEAYQGQADLYGSNWLVICDEAHRLGEKDDDDQRAWAEAVRYSFVPNVRYRANTTGTMFRTDDMYIHDVRYKPTNDEGVKEVWPHFQTSLPEGINNNWIRRLKFTTLDAKVEWYEHKNETIEERAAQLSDEHLGQQAKGRALRVATDTQYEYAQKLLKRAWKELMFRRQLRDDAAMIVVCRDKKHAADTQKWMDSKLERCKSVMVLGDSENADEIIEEFENGNHYSPNVIITVKKLAEGFNAPRLEVGVLLTNVKTRLNFEQTVARCNRNRSGKYEEAVWFIPGLYEFTKYALEYEQGLLHKVNPPDEGPQPKYCAVCMGPNAIPCPGLGIPPCPNGPKPPPEGRGKFTGKSAESGEGQLIVAGMTLPDGVEEAIRHRYTDESKALVILEFLSGLPTTTVQEWMQAQGIQLKPANTVENIPLVEQAEHYRTKYNNDTKVIVRAVMQRHHGLFDAGALMNLLHGNALKAGHISNNDTKNRDGFIKKCQWSADHKNRITELEDRALAMVDENPAQILCKSA